MSRRTIVFCVFAIACATLFVRLGFWQISRLHEKRARNEVIAAQQRTAPQPLASMPHDTGLVRYRPTSVDGRYDYAHELVLTSRTRRGSPGVELFTPVRIGGSDTAVLVNRGWVYSPDAGSVNQIRWREGDTARVVGYVELYSADAGASTAANPRAIRRVSRSEIEAKIPYPLAPFYVVAIGDTTNLSHPARRLIPVLGDGSHLFYAIQWFAFAAIALVGAAIVVVRERRSG